MLESLHLFLIFFLLPSQLGLHFWPTFSYLQGFRVDYLSPTLYLTDILLLLYVLRHLKFLSRSLLHHAHLLLLCLGIFFLNLLFSLSPLNTLFWFLRVSLYLLFVLNLRLRHYPLHKLLPPLYLGAILQILLATLQFFHQGSLNGLWYFLGERRFSLATPQVAKIDFFGRLLLRPYATFSHPNAFAGYLFLVLLLTRLNFKKSWLLVIPLCFALLLTFSKAALLTTFLLLLNLSPFIPLFFSLLSSLALIIPVYISTSYLPYFLSSRLNFLNYSLTLITRYPLFGVGFGNYLVGLTQVLSPQYLLPSNFQPVHHLPLLFLSEFGLLNLLSCLILLYLLFQKRLLTFRPKYFYILFLILLLSTFDHYFYTLPQTKLLLLITLSYLL